MAFCSEIDRGALRDIVRDVWLRPFIQRNTVAERNTMKGRRASRARDINAVSVAEVPTRDGLIAHFILAEKNPHGVPPPRPEHPTPSLPRNYSQKVLLPRFSN